MEEIIIDGVNVAGCEFYDNGSCRECDMRVPFYSDIDCYDKCNKECYYKQLKRLERENAELKEIIAKNNPWNSCKNCNKDYKQALEEIREIAKREYDKSIIEKDFHESDACIWVIIRKINEVIGD